VSTLYSGSISQVGIWSDTNGNIFGCETGFHSVFKVTSGGVKTDFAGTRGTAGVTSEGVLALNALFNSPRAVWGDEQFLYVTDMGMSMLLVYLVERTKFINNHQMERCRYLQV
jgi:hypothetical protein